MKSRVHAPEAAEAVTSRQTPAICFLRCFELLGDPGGVPRVAVRLGVSRESVWRWLQRGKDELEGRPDPRGTAPDWSRVLHLRALVLIRAAVPGAVPALSWGQDWFEEALFAVPRVRLSYEADPRMAVVRDGADD